MPSDERGRAETGCASGSSLLERSDGRSSATSVFLVLRFHAALGPRPLALITRCARNAIPSISLRSDADDSSPNVTLDAQVSQPILTIQSGCLSMIKSRTTGVLNVDVVCPISFASFFHHLLFSLSPQAYVVPCVTSVIILHRRRRY